MPPVPLSDHPGADSGIPVGGQTLTGPQWVAQIVDAVGNSNYWGNTAILITWDDWGGFYDHVAPTVAGDLQQTASFPTAVYDIGFRVPLLVVSPYVKKGYVSHYVRNATSIIRFIETAFGLKQLSSFDLNHTDDLMEMFDFSGPPSPFVPITTNCPRTW